MKQRPRIYYTESQKNLIWNHWKKDESLHQIAQLFDRNHSSVHRILAETSGIRPVKRGRSRLALSQVEPLQGIVMPYSLETLLSRLGTNCSEKPATIARLIISQGFDVAKLGRTNSALTSANAIAAATFAKNIRSAPSAR